ncbi:MAG: hypothetical protein CSB47_03750 [Proteobacteria bacterium]|nr:MAG: hypothetical protein CSB47_03750 [Pseudomonadota bacterium]
MKAFEPVRVENCKNCGFPMRQYNPNSIVMVCESCGTRTGEDKQPPTYKPEIPHNPLFKLHALFEIRGTTWQVVGCQSYSGFTEEWDDEDDLWEETPWSYHTWWVINELRELAWIVQDQTGYHWSRKSKISGGIPKGDTRYEVGHWTLLSAVGEFSYRPAENEQVLTYERGNKSLEILLDEQGNHKEIEAFEAVEIDPTELLAGFGKTDVLAALERARLATRAALLTIVCLIVGFLGMHFFEKTLLVIPTTQITPHSLKQPVQLGDFSLNRKSLLEFSVSASFGRRDGALNAELVITDKNRATVAEVPISFWRESGYDSDGSWTESQHQDAPRIVLPSGDQYQVTLLPETLSKWPQVAVSGKITKNVVSLMPVVVGGICALLLVFFLNRLRRKRIREETGV